MSSDRVPGRLALATLLALTCGGCTHARPDIVPGHRLWELRGAVSDLEEPVLHVRHKSGQLVAITTDRWTVYTGKSASSFAALHVGTRVRVDLDTQGALNIARRVRVF